MFGFLKNLPWLKPTDALIRQNHEYFSNFDQNLPLSEYRFVVFDTELTGLHRRNDEIVSIGAVRIDNLQIDLSATYYTLVRPKQLEHTDATLVHRITPEQLKIAPNLEDVFPEFLRFVGNDLLVGHYVDLDMSFVNRTTKAMYGGTLANICIDTMLLSQAYKKVLQRYYHEMDQLSSSYRLSDLGEDFNLPQFSAHDALEDALQTAYLFLYLIKKFRKGGLLTLRDLYRAGRSGNWEVM